MKLQINGEERSFGDAATPFTLADLVDALGMKADRVAIELNRDIVARDRWSETKLAEGDRLEVVHFVGGGSALPSPHCCWELS
ncbi:MAG: sulfur carrier protein ThiS [Acidobacteriia bacterium]|nr:sulfur carrier protein ThiS [Terriglobia bacterium]